MSKLTENTKFETGSGIHELIRVSCSGKPYIYFNYQADIIDCNEASVSLFKISKKELLASRLSVYSQNKQFVQAIQKAGTEGISVFKGNVFLGITLSGVYLETVLFSNEPSDHLEKGIVCYILESKLSDSDAVSAEVFGSKISEITDFLYASVSVHSVDGNVIYISPSVESLLGYTSNELKEMNPLSAVFPDDVHIVRNVVEKLNGGYDYFNSRYRMVKKDGTIINVESSSYLISDIKGTGKHILNVTWDLSSQGKIERALRRSEQKYYRLVMNLPTGISLISPNGHLIELNDAMKTLMGLPKDTQLPDMNFFSIEAMKHAGIDGQLTKCIVTKEIVNGDLNFKPDSRSQAKFLTYSFVPVLNNEQEIDIIIGYVSDLTQQKKSEIESRERAEFLNLVINAIKSPFFVKDEEHKWAMLNDAAVEMMGQPREALIGKTDYDLYPKEQADIFWKYDELVFKTGSNTNEEQITWSDGKIHTIVTYKQLYIEKSSGKKFIVGTIHDISNYKKIEEELRASELKYHELFDNANDFILTIDLEGKITNANRTLLNYLQTELVDFMNHTVYDFISDENLDSVIAFKEKLLTGISEGSFEINTVGIDKQPVTYEVKASVIRKNGIQVGVQCVFSDITESRVARQRLEEYNKSLLELNKTKDKFFSIIAHDLRNPYSSLLGFTDLLLEDLEKLSTNEIRDYLKIIRNSAKNSLNLLENLLAWSRLETGRMPFDPVKIILSNSVDEVINVLFSLAFRKKIDINNLVDSDIWLNADKNMLNTILNNLVMNAIKFTHLGGEINIIAGEPFILEGTDKEFVKISVSDTGVGMEADVCENLFVANKPSSIPGTEKEEGTGLGLLISREMVEKHGGKITADSTPGKGSVFSFLMPVYKS